MHAIKVGLFKEDCTVDVKDVLILPQSETNVEFDATNNYKALLLNYEDYSFVKSLFDEGSAHFFAKNLNQIKDLLSRSLIWRTYYDLFKDAKINVNKYIDFFLNNIEKEQNDGLFEKQFDLVNASINVYTPKKGRDGLNEKVFELIKKLIGTTDKETGANRIVILKSKFISFANTDKLKKFLISWRAGEVEELKEHPQTIGQQWSTVVKAFTLTDLTLEEKEKLFADQEKIDSSDTAKNNRRTCDSLKSTDEEYEAIYNSYKNDGELSLKQRTHSINGWNTSYHNDRLEKYRERYFKDLPIVAKELNYDNAVLFLENL